MSGVKHGTLLGIQVNGTSRSAATPECHEHMDTKPMEEMNCPLGKLDANPSNTPPPIILEHATICCRASGRRSKHVLSLRGCAG